jgi:2-oxoglutarate ferredoxin oxidoreductase subunit alpha
MVETLSYAGVAEIPIVVFLGQRPGPATGMPTWTEQGDLLFTVHAGHGEFPKIVLAPGDINEMLELTMKAFDMADIYQVPVIVMSDKLIGESHTAYDKSAMMSFISNYKINRGKTVRQSSQKKYLRYKLSDDGISERLIPGQKGQFYQANSYEHVEDSHTTEDSQVRLDQVNKRNKKQDIYLNTHFSKPTIFGTFDEAEICFVSWGGNKGAILDAQKMLLAENIKSSYIHFTHVYPLSESIVKPYFEKNKRYILIENNSHAQFGKLLRMEAGVEIKEKILKYDGRPIFPEDIVTYIKKSTS